MEAEAEAILAPYFEALAQGEGVDLPIPLQATANIPSTTDVTLSCNRFGGGATGVTASVSFGNSLIATTVGGVGP